MKRFPHLSIKAHIFPIPRISSKFVLIDIILCTDIELLEEVPPAEENIVNKLASAYDIDDYSRLVRNENRSPFLIFSFFLFNVWHLHDILCFRSGNVDY
jgi:hypothetical protein